VITRIKNTELLSLGKNRFQANLTLFIVLFYVGLFFGRAGEITRIASFWMEVLALIAVSAFSIYEVLANDLFLVAVDEMLNQGVFVVL
jgi:hypothetical protein